MPLRSADDFIAMFELTRRTTRANPIVSGGRNKLMVNPLQLAAINDTAEGAQVILAGGLAFDVVESYDDIRKRLVEIVINAK